jgi:hypothetical protein
VDKYHPRSKLMVWSSCNRLARGAVVGLLFVLFAVLQPASAQNHLGGYQSSAGVSVASFQNSLFMAYIGTDSNHTINIGQSSDGLNWSLQWQISDGGVGFQRSFDTPALAYFNGKLWLAWAGTVGSGSNINLASSTDAHNFSDTIIGSYTSAHGISLFANNGKLYLAWVPADLSYTVKMISSTDGVNWSPTTSFGLPGKASPWTPTIAVYGTDTWLGYTKPSLPEDPYARLQLGLLSGGFAGVAPPNPSTGVNAGAGMAWDGGSLFYYAWVGPGRANEEWLTTYQLQANGSFSLILQTDMGHTGISTPCVVGNWNGHAFLIFPGTDSAHHVNVLTIK